METMSIITRKKNGTTILKCGTIRLCFLNINDALYAANRIREVYKTTLTNREINAFHPFARRAIEKCNERRGISVCETIKPEVCKC